MREFGRSVEYAVIVAKGLVNHKGQMSLTAGLAVPLKMGLRSQAHAGKRSDVGQGHGMPRPYI